MRSRPPSPNQRPPVAAWMARERLRTHLLQAPLAELTRALDLLQAGPEPAPWPPRRQAIVVLGTPLHGNGAPSEGLLRRVERAAALAQRHPRATVVVTGGAVANRYSEAWAMAERLEALGVAPSRLMLEPNARTTLDNAAYTLTLLASAWPEMARHGVQLTVVTEPYHAPRALRLFAAASEALHLPVTLRLAVSERAPLPGLPEVGEEGRLGPGFMALLQRCIEEKRRMARGW